MIIRTIFIVITIFLATPVYADVLYNENLDGYADKTAAIAGVWGGATDGLVTLEDGAECRGGSGKCWLIDWTEARSIDPPLLIFPDTSRPQIYVRFYHKQTGTGGINSKVMKLFNGGTSSNYCHFTAQGSGYTRGVLHAMAVGSGATLENDGTCLYRYFASEDGCLGSGTVNTYTPAYSSGVPFADGEWHCIEYFIKMNSDDNSDAQLKMWYDGTLVYDVSGIKIRHNDNTYYWHHVTFGDYAGQTGFQEYFDDIVVSDDYIGPLDWEPSCTDTPGLCGSQSACEDAGWYWCDGTCQASACEEEPPLTPVKTSTWNVPGTVRVR